jgi:hypothetical protein
MSFAAACYVAFWRGKSLRRRVLTALALLIAGSQVLPLLFFPEDALRLIRRVGGPVMGFAGAYLALELLWDRLAAWRRAAPDGPAS